MRLAIVIAAILVLGLIQTASATTYINHSMTITKPGVYILSTNLTGNGGGIGIAIYSNNVTLIGNGHMITGFDTGIFMKGNNVTVKDCIVNKNKLGIQIKGNDNNLVNCTFYKNGFAADYTYYGKGIMINGNYNKIVNCTVSWNGLTYYYSVNHGEGIVISGHSNIILRSNITDNGDWLLGKGIVITGDKNKIADSKVASEHIGIDIRGDSSRIVNSSVVYWGMGVGLEIVGNRSDIFSCFIEQRLGGGGTGIGIFGNYNKILNCVIKIKSKYQTSTFGIDIVGANNKLVNCTVENGRFRSGIATGYEPPQFLWINSENNTVINCKTVNSEYGIFIGDNNSKVVNCNASNNVYCGISIYGWNNTLINCITNKNKGVGIQIMNSNSKIINCTSSGNKVGMEIDTALLTAFNNTIYNNHILYNHIGLQISHSSSNLIYNNYFNNSKNVLIQGKCTNRWNITPTPGKNIVGGPYIAGNYWATSSGTGFSQVTPDKNGDGICDSPYKITTNNTDYLPLSLNYSVVTPPVPENPTSALVVLGFVVVATTAMEVGGRFRF